MGSPLQIYVLSKMGVALYTRKLCDFKLGSSIEVNKLVGSREMEIFPNKAP
jgi:hypothetical protein